MNETFAQLTNKTPHINKPMTRNNSAIDPEMLSQLNADDRYIQSNSRQARQVRMERGRIWKVRFLPAKLGPNKMWYARIAKHWLSKTPIFCPENTHPDFGGNPKFKCPVCAVSQTLNDSPDEQIGRFGYDCRGAAQWLTFCVVLEKDGAVMPIDEVVNPYEFWHYKNTWEELKGFFKSNASKGNPMSVLDYLQGFDFNVTKNANGMRLDKLDSVPIIDMADENYQAYIDRIESRIRMPRLLIPTREELNVFAGKVEDACQRLHEPEGGRGLDSAGHSEDVRIAAPRRDAPVRRQELEQAPTSNDCDDGDLVPQLVQPVPRAPATVPVRRQPLLPPDEV